MPMKRSRRSLLLVTALLTGTIAGNAVAQFGGRHNRGNGASGASRSAEGSARGGALTDPVLAIDRELASLRVDLKLTAQQDVLFDSFEGQVHDAADAARSRARHLSSFRSDEGSSVTADTVLRTMADDDVRRADAMRQALDRMNALIAALTPDQRKQFDRRILQSLRDPLGSS
jgi:hypothetical protein